MSAEPKLPVEIAAAGWVLLLYLLNMFKLVPDVKIWSSNTLDGFV